MCFATRYGTPGRLGVTRRIRPSAGTRRRRTWARRPRRRPPAGAAARRVRPVGPRAFHSRITVGDRQRDLLAVAQHGGVDEVGDRLGVEGGVTTGQHDRVVLAPIDRVQRHPGQVDRVQHVGVAELGGETDAEHVERADRTVVVEGELRHALLPHQLFQIGPDRVRPLGQDPVPLVEHLVQDRDALVGQSHLVRVRVHQAPADVDRVPVLDDAS